MRNRKINFAVIGAGGGGQAMAGYLALKGHATNLYNRSAHRIDAIRRRGGIFLEGKRTGFARLNEVTTELSRAVRGVDVVMVVVPASAHREIATRMANYLQPGQMVVLNPGRTGGALEFRFVLDGFGVTDEVLVAEAQTLIFASRVVGPARARIFGIKRKVPVAALPAVRTAEVLTVLGEIFSQFTAAESVLQTSLDNIGAIFHPAPTLLNAARIEGETSFEYYCQGVSPSVARVLEEMDEERRNVALAMGVHVRSAERFLREAYGVRSRGLYRAMRSNPGYAGILAPTSVEHRYITEDVPTSLVPMASFGDIFGAPTPTIKSIIHLACIMGGVDYWRTGRTVDRLGLSGMNAAEIREMVTNVHSDQMVG